MYGGGNDLSDLAKIFPRNQKRYKCQYVTNVFSGSTKKVLVKIILLTLLSINFNRLILLYGYKKRR